MLQRDWFHARARGYKTTLDAALHGNNIPTSVVENLIAVTKQGVEPLRRYHRLRRRVLGARHVPAVRRLRSAGRARRALPVRRRRAPGSSIRSRRSGATTSSTCASAFDGRWIDVFENAGKRSGAYSAPVYGAHPYMLLNYNETLDAVFTLAHEMGHSMHTLLSHQSQPFVYAGYTIFVAEVPSTLNEALFLDLMLERARSRERARRAAAARDRQHREHVLHAGDVRGLRAAGAPAGRAGPAGHRRRAQRRSTRALLRDYYGDVIDEEELSRVTWARIPHFFSTPYYVYQYATCFASTARLMQDLRSKDRRRRWETAVQSYLRCCAPAAATTRWSLAAPGGVDLASLERCSRCRRTGPAGRPLRARTWGPQVRARQARGFEQGALEPASRWTGRPIRCTFIRIYGYMVAILDHMSALSDPTRCRMLLLLEKHELTVSELCAVLQMPQSSVSRHLKTLADDDWVASRRDGTSRFYSMPLDELDSAASRLWPLIREQVARRRPRVRTIAGSGAY